MKPKNLNVYPPTKEEADRLYAEYVSLGFYVTRDGDRLVVHTLHPAKKKDKDVKERRPQRDES